MAPLTHKERIRNGNHSNGRVSAQLKDDVGFEEVSVAKTHKV